MPQADETASTIQSARNLVSEPASATAASSEIERTGRELARLQDIIDGCNEVVQIRGGYPEFKREGPDRDAFRDVEQALKYAERKKDALLRLLSTQLPSTLSEVQVMQVIALQLSRELREMRECSVDDSDKEILKHFDEAIRDGIALIAGRNQSDIGMRSIGSGSWIRPVLRDLPADKERIRAALEHCDKLWRSRHQAA